ncbi:two-component system sensor histidine kinase and response regulator WspE [Acidovorax soli]|jgi:two-component system sensor histidine kinase and response regulator WspE|uniref:Chemotaxis protein CheA n=1 Tax=Acidovorax soli TaxID=592050 RepID=A0A7X0UBC4_9BURK|nr:hybrid sensor histidine kinase/response regulator [Acidovorax soli]MBB6562231.1 two-component system sensor histidine kinase and response regulator WspE [Acidovorax soli]
MNLDAYKDRSLQELFRLEAQAQTEVMNSGLLVLEREPTDPAQLDACMRAAHSLKGAARIIGLDAAVDLAHVMEDLLVAAQRGELRLGKPHIDALLQGSDALLQLSEGATVDGLAALHKRLSAGAQLGDGEPTPAPTPAFEAPEQTTPPAQAPEPQPLPAEPQDRILRVSADRLDDLLDLAGRSLVAAQRTKPLGQGLERLKRLQQQIGRSLRGLRDAMPGQELPPQAKALLADASNWVLEAQTQLQQHTEAFDSFAWAFGQRSQRLYDAALASRMRPCADLMAGKARMVRDLGHSLGKEVWLALEGEDIQGDRDVLERLEAPLIQLLRNAVDHGIESPEERLASGKPAQGHLVLRARHAAGRLLLELQDDGAGVDLARLRATVIARRLATEAMAQRMHEEELLAFLFLPGFSMSEQVSEISGRGVGLDVVQHALRQLRGTVRVRQQQGRGTLFQMELPLTLSVLRSLVVEIGGEAYALPLARVEQTLRVPPDAITLVEGQQHLWHRGRPVGLVAAHQLLQLPPGKPDALGLPVVLVPHHERSHAIAVDRFMGEQSLVVIPVDPRLGLLRGVEAGALLDDGSPVLILDVDELMNAADKLLGAGQVERVARFAGGPTLRRKRVLVVDDSLTVRELERKLLAGRGYEVTVAVDGMDGWNALRAEDFDLLVTDIDMPRMDGIELVGLVRRDARLQSLPVVVVSYKDREEDRRRGLDAGADHYLAKSSFHDETLLEAVQMLIGEALE